MPEMTFHVRWPDGTEERCYSPSLVMHDYLEAGSAYPVAEFVDRSTEALQLASQRVKAKFGFECTSAMAQEAEIRDTAARFDRGSVRILAMDPPQLPTGAGS
ncbi:MSMEG_0570 family nitrogen starvation response protein [Microbacteriaceae bacterium VKM Ac-2854]|nr:MSMEG_0570 family nitrogen starvation response protein [Microbacteriaceae bacterium VKM Ac-2854]